MNKTHQVTQNELDQNRLDYKSTIQVGFFASITTSLVAIITFGIAVLTPPLSGPFCLDNCLKYPYYDIASRFPRDYLWMYPAIILQIAITALFVSIYHFVPKTKRVFGSIGLVFIILSAFVLMLDYFVQVSVIQPSLLLEETEGIALLTQFNPHGIFIVLEELGFFLSSIGLLFFGFALQRINKLLNTVSWIFKINFILNVLAFIGITMMYGIHREYRFEVATISINWLTIIISSLLMTKAFKNEL